jgi:glycosyltransferase involved in cell wall biosynthesis
LAASPKVSIVLIAYRMSRQLENTLRSLMPDCQWGVTADDYEVIVMENSSDDPLSPEFVASLPANFRYQLRQESTATPVYAINEAFALCRGPLICLMIDGARMASPGIISTALMAYRMNSDAVVVVPGYHLGHDEQHLLQSGADIDAQEQELLASVDWQADGYELFRISTFSGANRNGYLQPIMECNCLFASADNYAAIGHANEDFQLPGGGSINLHMYRSLGMLPHSELFVMPGEGSFHQYHGGVTTSSYAERDAEIEKHRIQLHSYWPGGFHSLRREPALLGRVPPQAQPFLEKSLQRSQHRYSRISSRGDVLWPDDAGR